jgi:hypothetical protein
MLSGSGQRLQSPTVSREPAPLQAEGRSPLPGALQAEGRVPSPGACMEDSNPYPISTGLAQRGREAENNRKRGAREPLKRLTA